VTARVRAATSDDAPALAQVAAATFGLACPPHVTQASIDSFIAKVLSQECFERYLAEEARDLLVAEDGREAVGYAMTVAGDPADEDVAAAVVDRPAVELSKIYVLPQAHGSGAAGALMTASLRAARSRGAAVVWLGVNQLNERAQKFYRKSGFRQVGTKRFLVGENYEDDYVFAQVLP
jgi:diamine N-acetyltransferase